MNDSEAKIECLKLAQDFFSQNYPELPINISIESVLDLAEHYFRHFKGSERMPINFQKVMNSQSDNLVSANKTRKTTKTRTSDKKE